LDHARATARPVVEADLEVLMPSLDACKIRFSFYPDTIWGRLCAWWKRRSLPEKLRPTVVVYNRKELPNIYQAQISYKKEGPF